MLVTSILNGVTFLKPSESGGDVVWQQDVTNHFPSLTDGLPVDTYVRFTVNGKYTKQSRT